MAISSYASTAAGNNTGGSLFPEGMLANQVNDSLRQLQADVRTWYNDAEWVPLGHTTVYVSGTAFRIVGADQTAFYTVGRRIRAVGSSTGTIYGKIATSVYSSDTDVTVTWDSGSLVSETLTISVALIKGATSGQSIDITNLAGAGTMAVQNANNINVTGGAITGITDLAIADGGTGASTAAAGFAALKQDATTSETGVVELATAAETLTGTDATRALTSAGFAGNNSLGTTGHYKLPGGLVIQWGIISTGGAATGSVTFGVALTTLYNLQADIMINVNLDTYPVSNTGFSWVQGGTFTADIHWFAIGV